MVSPRVLILRAPGANCDGEAAHAFLVAGGTPERVHINRWLERPDLVDDFQILCIPGGFSYGDDVSAGRILASQLEHHLADVLRRFRDRKKLILGICNGFQVLLKTGLLVAPDGRGPVATLAWNDSGRFEDRWVRLQTAGRKCVFLSGVDSLDLPVAHGEGKLIVRDGDALGDLHRNGQLVLRYARKDGSNNMANTDTAERIPYPDNPNGSQWNVAGLCDASGRIFGMMPHPERYLDRTNHPRWTREELPETGAGLRIFENAIAYFA